MKKIFIVSLFVLILAACGNKQSEQNSAQNVVASAKERPNLQTPPDDYCVTYKETTMYKRPEEKKLEYCFKNGDRAYREYSLSSGDQEELTEGRYCTQNGTMGRICTSAYGSLCVEDKFQGCTGLEFILRANKEKGYLPPDFVDYEKVDDREVADLTARCYAIDKDNGRYEICFHPQYEIFLYEDTPAFGTLKRIVTEATEFIMPALDSKFVSEGETAGTVQEKTIELLNDGQIIDTLERSQE